tara:strand:- start:460 stop:828 length:369 start_codon:yes stop_codon:yes gene_type:complete
MTKQIKSSEVKKFILENQKAELLDVRTSEEWDSIGRPEGETLGIRTHYISINQTPDNLDFIEEVKKEIDTKTPLLVMCKAGVRSVMAAELLLKENYNCVVIIDGFEGNGEDLGWKEEGLPYF